MADGTEVLLTYERSPNDPHLFIGITRTDSGDERPWSLRPLALDELDTMAHDAGFELEGRWGTWSRDHFYERHGKHVSVWRRGAGGQNRAVD